ncbi:MAG: exodeoxyribonuclease VII small subunit [Spirochaetaceae bacterium]|nr:exodeoxyribonuclease VII small subunit [Spirochaetaceae bacterium]
MKNFEEKLERLEQLGSDIKKSDVSLEEALKCFEEGIALARGMEKELDKIEGKIQMLMNQPDIDGASGKKPELDLFSAMDE